MGIEPSPTVDAKCDKDDTELRGKSQLAVTSGQLDHLNKVICHPSGAFLPRELLETMDAVNAPRGHTKQKRVSSANGQQADGGSSSQSASSTSCDETR